ncbi:MAG: protein-glutamine glutaminase family protein [bacterium]
MPNKNALIGLVVRIDPPLDRQTDERGYTIELDGDRRARLEASDKNAAGLARVLDGLRQLRRPVYLEVDPDTAAITRVLIPHVTRVAGLKPIDTGVLGVELELSHARHLLRGSTDDAADIEKLLREAIRTRTTVVVTETDAHEIIDVRPYTPIPGEELPHFPRPEYPARVPWSIDWIKYHWWRLWCWRCWPWWWFRCLSMKRAQQVFDTMSATSCNPLTVPAPCIPFLYPDDGCWGRASEMCRLMINLGLSPKKVWIQGSLHVSTKNNPGCAVFWGWHVAPTLCVRGPKFFQSQQMVFDPSLFATPVSQTAWKGVQGDPGASLTPSAASIFYLWGSVTDPGYVQTNQVLATYRLNLQNRSLGPSGPPPYAGCP